MCLLFCFAFQKDEVDEEIFGYLRSAAGKARLLATQKFKQFEGESTSDGILGG